VVPPHPPQEPSPSRRIPLPWSRSCFVCGEANPHGLRARSFMVDGRVELPFTAEERFVGWNGVIHGGFIATVLDEVMTWSAILGAEKPCFAAEFTVRLLHPLPSQTRCTAVSELVGTRRKKVLDTRAWVQGEDGTVYARATGRYMPVPPGHDHHLREDFVRDESCLDVGGIFGS